MIYVPIAYFLTFLFLIKVRKINIPEAFFIASPGGLLEMVLGAESCGADSKQVGIIHMIRIFLTVFIVFWNGIYFMNQVIVAYHKNLFILENKNKLK